MEKSKKAEWYRFGTFILHKNEHAHFTIYKDGVEKYGSFEMVESNSYLKPLEYLTPKEALLFLAHGFTLGKLYNNHNNENIFEQIRLVDNQIHYVDGLSIHGSWRWYGLDNFTIHALPPEKPE